MTPDQREAILANAKYLRNLRPIDPTEIPSYVEGQPRAAVIRRVLREAAVDLELIERADGRFVPVSDDPVHPLSDPVTTFPGRYGDVLSELLVERYGPTWWAGESGERLRSAIQRLKEHYFRGQSVEYDEDTAFGYAIYHLPDYYASIQYVLDDLAELGRLPRKIRAVDVGAGVGGPALGIADFLPGGALLEYHAIEPSPASAVLDALLDETGRNVHASVHRTTAERFEPSGEFDLILFANVLSELDDPLAVVERYAGHLSPGGSLLLLAPADLETSTGLRRIERALVDDLTVYSPTVRLWPGYEPRDRGWSFDVRPDLDAPGFQTRLDEAGCGSGEFLNVDVQFSYAVLRNDGERRIEIDLAPGRFARFADSETHVTDRIDCAAIKLSHDLAESENPVYKVGDGSEQVGHFAVMTKETGLNRRLLDADYGDLLFFESVLLLWNGDEEAYNLVVDGETVVHRHHG